MNEKKQIERRVFLLKERKKIILFGYLCCIRMYSNYAYFSSKEKFGNPSIIIEALGLAKLYLLDEKVDENVLQDCLNELYQNIPHSEDYPSLEASYAERAIASVYYLLSFILKNDVEDIVRIFINSIDLIDFFLINELEIVQDWELHPLFILEKKNQEVDYKKIQVLKYIDRSIVEDMEVKYKDYPIIRKIKF